MDLINNTYNMVSLPQMAISLSSSNISFSEVVFLLFLSFMILLSMLIIFSKDVIYCLLGLISLYVMGAILLLSYNLQFLAFALVVVSLGAVAVLFLYVVLMVNLKGSRMQESMFYKFNISSFLMGLSLLVGALFWKKDQIDAIYSTELFMNGASDQLIVPFYVNALDMALEINDNTLKLYGLIVYDKYFILFVLIGILLLAALIGCLLLSYEYDHSQGENPSIAKVRLEKINQYN